jgi:hypothetical protein
MATIVVFGLALLGLALLILFKYIELRTGKRVFAHDAVMRWNTGATSLVTTVKYRVFQFIQIIRYIVLVKLPEKGRVSYQEAREVAVREVEKRREVLMGRKVLKQNGSVSFFLKKIKEEAPRGDGKIEEEI